MCGRKGPGARTRGRRRHPGKLGGIPPRSPPGARAAEETAYPPAPRLPRGSRWGRRREGARAARRRRAGRYPAAGPLPGGSRRRRDERSPTVEGGTGGKSPLPQEGLPDGSLRPEGQAGPTAARGEPSRPSPPAIRGRGRRRLAGGPSRLRPLSCGRGAAGWKGPVRRIRRISRPRTAAPAGTATPERACILAKARPPPAEGTPERNQRWPQPRGPQRAIREGGRCRRRSVRPLSCGRAPPIGVRFLRRRPSGEARLRCRLPRRYPAAAAPSRGSRPPSPAAICGRGGRRPSLGVFGTAGILPSRNFGEVGGRFRAPEPRFCGTECVRGWFSAALGAPGGVRNRRDSSLAEPRRGWGGCFRASEPHFCVTECLGGVLRALEPTFRGTECKMGSATSPGCLAPSSDPFCGPPGPPNRFRDPLSRGRPCLTLPLIRTLFFRLMTFFSLSELRKIFS